MFKKSLILLVLVTSLVPRPSEARVVRFVVEQKRPLAEGTSFGSAGAYERLDGTAYFEVDPRDPLNAVIVNLDRAPKNARGMVEFSAPFSILEPVDPAKGNHKIFYAINNRGNQQAISYFNFGRGGNNPLTASDVGDGFLMRLGYTIVDAAWEGDLVPGNGRLIPKFPVATNPDGSPIVAKIRIEYSDRTIRDKGTFTLPLEGAANFKAYPAVDANSAHATLTMRDDVTGAKPFPRIVGVQHVPDGKASLARTARHLSLRRVPRRSTLRAVYRGEDPIVIGLACAVTRDVGSFLRYRQRRAGPESVGASATPWASPASTRSAAAERGECQRVPVSRLQRKERIARCRTLWVHKSGTHRRFANVALPIPHYAERTTVTTSWHSYPPFTSPGHADPCRRFAIAIKAPLRIPRLQTDTESEFWEMKDSSTSSFGRPPADPSNVRL
jgi:hypothetical protein